MCVCVCVFQPFQFTPAMDFSSVTASNSNSSNNITNDNDVNVNNQHLDDNVNNDTSRNFSNGQPNTSSLNGRNCESTSDGPDFWWLNSDSSSIVANVKASFAKHAVKREYPKDPINLSDDSDDEYFDEINKYRRNTISELSKLRPGFTEDGEVKIWATVFNLPQTSITKPKKRVREPASVGSYAPPTKKPKLKHAIKSTGRVLRTPLLRSSNTSSRHESSIGNDSSRTTKDNNTSVRYPRLNPLISFSENQTTLMLQRLKDVRDQSMDDDQLSDPSSMHPFQRIVRKGKFFDSSTLNDAFGKYMSSFPSSADAFGASLNIFWDDKILQKNSIRFDANACKIECSPPLPYQQEFQKYWNAVTDARSSSSSLNGQRNASSSTQGPIYRIDQTTAQNKIRFQRQESDDGDYYDVGSEGSASSSTNMARLSTSQSRQQRTTTNTMYTSTRDNIADSRPYRGGSSQGQVYTSTPARGHSHSNSPSMDRHSSYQTPSSNNNKHMYPPVNGGDTSSSISNYNSNAVKTSRISTNSSSQLDSSNAQGVGREIGSRFDNIFTSSYMNEMVNACNSLCKPIAAQPKAEGWLPSDAIERMNKLEFFEDLGLNLHIAVLILSQSTIGAAVRAVATVFWGQNELQNLKTRIGKPTSKTNMAPPPNTSCGLQGEEAFHSLWNCILQFDRDESLFERYLRAVNYITESVKRGDNQSQNRSYSSQIY